MKLHASSWKGMQAHGIACKLNELHESSWNCIADSITDSIQAHGTPCKLFELDASL